MAESTSIGGDATGASSLVVRPMWPGLVSAGLGLWTSVAPSLVGYGGSAALVDRLCGPVIAGVGLLTLWDVTRGLRWLNLVLGAWYVVATFVLPYPIAGRFSAAAVGLALSLCASVRLHGNGVSPQPARRPAHATRRRP